MRYRGMRYRGEMTRELAMAIGQDVGNRNMRKQKRNEWNIDDWNLAAETVEKLLKPLMDKQKRADS